jgi:carboxypeptidase C (cathepsin A)
MLSVSPTSRDIEALLNSEYIRTLIRTDPQPANFAILSEPVYEAFVRAGDMEDTTTTAYLAGLLERGVRVLIYAGMYDAAASWLDNERMTRIIPWSGRAAFAGVPMREWNVGGAAAGKVRSSGLLTYASIYGAGHLVSLLVPPPLEVDAYV